MSASNSRAFPLGLGNLLALTGLKLL